jgi:hypothetical protein
VKEVEVVVLPTLKKICDRDEYRRLFHSYDWGSSWIIYEGEADVGVGQVRDNEYIMRARLTIDINKCTLADIIEKCSTFLRLCYELKEKEREILEEAKALL